MHAAVEALWCSNKHIARRHNKKIEETITKVKIFVLYSLFPNGAIANIQRTVTVADSCSFWVSKDKILT